jgi:gamma-glutamylcyclotransferase (GGCT)/AIG2-like uncharacterized protein YtfP
MKSAFLFAYGSLLSEDNDFAIYLKDNSVLYSTGKVRGRLYDIGEYPGAILSAACDEYVYGSVLKIDRSEKVLDIIDDYEGYGGEQSWPNEFIRVLTGIETETGIINCWIYVYNLPVNGLKYIKGGRYFK